MCCDIFLMYYPTAEFRKSKKKKQYKLIKG